MLTKLYGINKKYRFEIYFPFVVVFSVKVMRFLPLKIYSFIWKNWAIFKTNSPCSKPLQLLLEDHFF